MMMGVVVLNFFFVKNEVFVSTMVSNLRSKKKFSAKKNPRKFKKEFAKIFEVVSFSVLQGWVKISPVNKEERSLTNEQAEK